MKALIIITKCTPAYVFYRGLFPKKSMIIFCEDAIYKVRLGRNYMEDTVGLAADNIGINLLGIGDSIGAKIDDLRHSKKKEEVSKKPSENIESLLSQEKKGVAKFEYSSLKKFIYRKPSRFFKAYLGFVFNKKKAFFFIEDKNVVDPVVALIKELAPNAKIKQKRGRLFRKT